MPHFHKIRLHCAKINSIVKKKKTASALRNIYKEKNFFKQRFCDLYFWHLQPFYVKSSVTRTSDMRMCEKHYLLYTSFEYICGN